MPLCAQTLTPTRSPTRGTPPAPPAAGVKNRPTSHFTDYQCMDTGSMTPCQQSPEAYLSPHDFPDYTRDYAARLCQRCPVLTQCALDALHGGASLDRHRITPAVDVLQAGVLCTGDAATARALAAVAGVPVPDDYRAAPRRRAPGDRCVHCDRPMVGWSRHDPPPPGKVAHHGRGYCQRCRSAYAAHVEQLKAESPEEIRRTRRVDRHRHHAETTWRHPVTGERGTVGRR